MCYHKWFCKISLIQRFEEIELIKTEKNIIYAKNGGNRPEQNLQNQKQVKLVPLFNI